MVKMETTPKQRVAIALSGGKPDRIPIMPIYDVGYVAASIGKDIREYLTASSQERISIIEENFLRHEVDGFFVHAGTNDDWVKHHSVTRGDDYWQVRDLRTGEDYRLLPDGLTAHAQGQRDLRNPTHGGVSKIQTFGDLESLVPAPPTDAEIEESGLFRPLRHLARKYPTHHFSFQLTTPMARAIHLCGGYEEGLITLAGDRPLFRELSARCARNEIARIQPGRKAGGDSVWFTSYYTGCDTISPRDYTELVFPYEREVCRSAREAGLFVLNWFLGDLMPILDQVLQLPIDALVLEQGRKGYEIDPVEIRRRVGSRLCLFGFGLENDYCEFNRESLTAELARQIDGAGRDGAFVVGTPIIPPNALPEALDYYFAEARRLGAVG
jgi:hypothetical protein